MKTILFVFIFIIPTLAFSQGLRPKNVPGGVKVEDPFEKSINKKAVSQKDREMAMKYLSELGYGGKQKEQIRSKPKPKMQNQRKDRVRQ